MYTMIGNTVIYTTAQNYLEGALEVHFLTQRHLNLAKLPDVTIPIRQTKKLNVSIAPYLESEDHVELLALEPADCVGVLRHGQRLAPDPEDEASPLHQPEGIE